MSEKSCDCSSLSLDTNWQRLAYPRLCGLVAAKPSRLGQAMHNAAFLAAQLPFHYCAFETTRTEVALEAMRELGIRGLSLTIPHKERAMSLVDAISPEVKSLGAINTVINTGSMLLGLNTDYIGVQKALEEAAWKPESSRVLLLGAGGAARGALYALKDAGCRQIQIANRTVKRANDLAAQFGASVLGYESLTELDPESFDVFINTTSIGMPGGEHEGDHAAYPMALKVFNERHLVFDMVTAETPLILQAQSQGTGVIRGIRMLLHQAVEQNRLFTEQSPDVSVMETALLSHYDAQ